MVKYTHTQSFNHTNLSCDSNDVGGRAVEEGGGERRGERGGEKKKGGEEWIEEGRQKGRKRREGRNG